MNSNYKVAYNYEFDKLKKLDLADLANRLKVIYNKGENTITIPYFEQNYIMDLENNTIYKQEDGSQLNIGESIIILNYLTHSEGYIQNSYKWVSLKEIQGGGALFYPAFHKSSIEKLIKEFGQNIEEFKIGAQNVGGKEIKFGHIAYEFQVLPKISICIAMWEGDDEIPSNATILFDPSIQYLVHIETVIGIGMLVAEKVSIK